MELYSQYILAFDLGYITSETLEVMTIEIREISRMISGLKKNYDLKS